MNHVYLSYRHESDDHAKAVRNLGEKLRAAGLPVELDQFYIEDHPGGPDEGWRKWCKDRAEKSACVLIVCSKEWFDSYRNEGLPGKGLGAALEAAIFSGQIYDEKGRNARVRLVNLDNFSEAGIPQRLRDWQIFRLFSGVAEFDQMTKWIRQRLAMPGSSLRSKSSLGVAPSPFIYGRTSIERIDCDPRGATSVHSRPRLCLSFGINASGFDSSLRGMADFASNLVMRQIGDDLRNARCPRGVFG
jgi:hypothetical protein